MPPILALNETLHPDPRSTGITLSYQHVSTQARTIARVRPVARSRQQQRRVEPQGRIEGCPQDSAVAQAVGKACPPAAAPARNSGPASLAAGLLTGGWSGPSVVLEKIEYGRLNCFI
ncbi:hypothetical protein SAMCFNEI73_pC1638 (plasmid) [Sinorhizobium americanum]|uniref:Uncharacterized protein n=1 Tax=Sinorhizobium americanum TaxID=194963 RepID=A0A1L3LZ15_9HYPH|nr:hypothetical protein SAMCFNEI73_pC1638 [Sinorhizobium americanum]